MRHRDGAQKLELDCLHLTAADFRQSLSSVSFVACQTLAVHLVSADAERVRLFSYLCQSHTGPTLISVSLQITIKLTLRRQS